MKLEAKAWPMLCVLLIATLAAAAPPPAGLVQRLDDGALVEWTAGRIGAPGGAAADLRAPNTEIARVGAERAASERARASLARAVRALALASGGTVGARADADEAVAERLRALLAHARVVDVSWAADGGARVLLAVPLEAVRAAVEPPTPPVLDAAAPTALVVDGRKLAGLRPVLGVRVAARGAAPLALPTIWQTDPAAAAADARAGARAVPVAATGYDKGTIALALPAAELESAARAGALIVVLVGEGAKK